MALKVVHRVFQRAGGQIVQQFKIGDLVQLKSGGPALRVKEYLGVGDDGGAYQCQWSDGSTLKQGVFLGTSLKKFEGPPPRIPKTA